MKIIRDVNNSGKRRLILELDADEELVVLRGSNHYRLGQPIEDVVPAHVITEARPVQWCPVEQRWRDN